MPVEKREQVFVSSTYLDLKEERQEAIQTLLEADCIPAGMELFPASDDDKWTLIKRVIDDSDYYVVVIGGRYGSVDEERGISFTEMEFDYAVEQGIPVMGFLHGDPGKIVGEKIELDAEAQDNLEAFRAKIEKRMVKYWTSPQELGGQVAKSLIQLRKSHPAEGWVRASNALTPEVEREIAELRTRVAEQAAEVEAARARRFDRVEGLVQGSDPLPLSYEMSYWESGVTYFTPANAQSHYDNVTATVDSVFSALGPLMIDEAAERKLVEQVNRFIENIMMDEHQFPAGVSRYQTPKIEPDDFQQLKVQLFALGLIEKSERRRTVQDRNTYWKLTELGQEHLMTLRALRRKVEAHPANSPAAVDAPSDPAQ